MKTATAPETVTTKYGILQGMTRAKYHANGNLERCTLVQPNRITLPSGVFVPQYEDQYADDRRRKQLTKSLTFYEDGTIASMVLQDATAVTTGVGRVRAEMINFHENGTIKRIFPVYGTISAFWTEADEHHASPELALELPTGTFNGKIINLAFYPTREFKSITLWQGDFVVLQTPVGAVRTRIGFCLYRDGSVKSVEPDSALKVDTPIGVIPAFDPDALGMDGGNNSLVFAQDGSIESLFTSRTQVAVTHGENERTVHAPTLRLGHFADVTVADPMKISFSNGCVRFGERGRTARYTEYRISECSFTVEPLGTPVSEDTCDACEA